MLECGFLSGKYLFELKILAKYLYFTENKKKREVKDTIISFCERWFPGFNFNIEYKMINRVIRYLSSKKCRYIVIDSVFISDKFVQYFLNLDFDREIKKFLFALAVLGKVNKEIGFSEEYVSSYTDFRDVKRSAGVELKGDIYIDVLYPLYEKGILRSTCKGVLNLLFVKEIPKEQEIYKISDFHNIGLWLDFYEGLPNIKKCEKCGEIFKKGKSKKSPQKYCLSCSAKTKFCSKRFVCKKCGKEVFANSKSQKELCEKCYVSYRKEYFKTLYISNKQRSLKPNGTRNPNHT